jgi:transcriptional regulator with XRE-family HTH domain
VDIRQLIGKKIAEARRGRGWTQDALAQHLNKTRQTISIYERGTKGIPLSELEALAAVLEVPIQYFFSDSGVDFDLLNVIDQLTPPYRHLALIALKKILARQQTRPTHKMQLGVNDIEIEIEDEMLIKLFQREEPHTQENTG